MPQIIFPFITFKELASVLPNRAGGRGVHSRTIDRRVDRKILPPPDVDFGDGTRGWKPETLEAHGIHLELSEEDDAGRDAA